MIENKILIDNFYDFNLELTFSNNYKVIQGLHLDMNELKIKQQTISEIFKALLLHDKIVISTSNLFQIERVFGLQDTVLLLKTNRFELIDDNGLTIALKEKLQNQYSIVSITSSNENGKIKNTIEWLESRLYNKDTNNQLLNVLLLNAEKFNKPVDSVHLSNQIVNEIQYDITNTNVSKYLQLDSTSYKNITKNDIYNLIRLSKLNKTLIYSSNFNINNMSIDAGVKNILEAKLPPSMKEKNSINLFNDVFSKILQKKEIPDLSELYIKNIITLADYLEIIETLNAIKFRKWINDKDYDPAKLESDLLSSKISNKYIDLIRWFIPNAIGIVSPILGVTSSFADSFIVDKLMKGWHPNLFLDDILKQKIDKKIANHKEDLRKSSIKNKSHNIGRNDLCPCGSKKKFKHCCGK